MRPLWAPAAEAATEEVRRRSVDIGSSATPTDPAVSQPFIGRLAQWPLVRPERSGRQTAVAIAVLVAALRFPSVVNGEWGNFFAHAAAGSFVLAWMLLITLLVRTVTPRQVFSTWLSGVFVAGAVVDGVGTLLDDFVTGNLFIAVIVPILEEFMKLVPVLFVVILAKRRARGISALDLCLLGAASGAGFAMYEDMLWSRNAGAGIGGGWSTILPTITLEPVHVSGHLVWAAVAALGLGAMLVHGRSALAWIVGPVCVAIPLLDHMSINYRGDEFAALRSALLDGKLSTVLLVVGIGVALAHEVSVVHRSSRRDHLFRSRSFKELVAAPFPSPFSRSTSERQFQRVWNSVVFRDHVVDCVDARSAKALADIEGRLVRRPSVSTLVEGSTGDENQPIASTKPTEHERSTPTTP